MHLRARLIGLAVFALALLGGAIFNVLASVLALLAAVILAAPTWFNSNPRWLRRVWYGGLLVGAGAMYFVAPGSVVGGAVSSCEEIPALSMTRGQPRDDETQRVSNPRQHSQLASQDALNDAVHENGGFTSEAAYLVSVERNEVRYEERVDLHLKRGHFVSLDLSELGRQSARLGHDVEFLVGGDGMVAETFTPNELAGSIGLSTRPSSVWIETRMSLPLRADETCRGVTLMPFRRVTLAWPQPLDTQISGHVRLPPGDERVPFSERIDKQHAQTFEVLLPHNALFVQRPVQLKPKRVANGEASVDRFVPAGDAIDVAAFSLTAELLPDNSIVRSNWFYEKRAAFLPPNWILVLCYVLIVSAIGDVFMRRWMPPN